MSNSQYSIDYQNGGAKSSAPAQEILPASMPPHFITAPRRGLSAVVQGFFVAAGTLALVVGLEIAAPLDWKPSSVFGSYNGRLAAEIKAHDLETHAQYESWAQGVQLSVNQQMDSYRAKVQSVAGHYQSAMERAQMFAGSTARMQESYLQQRMGQVMAQQAGDMAVVNMSRMLGDLVSPFDPASGEKVHTYANDINTRLKKELDDAINSGVVVKVEGWDINLPSPDEVRAELSDLPPIQLPPLPRLSRDARGNPSGER